MVKVSKIMILMLGLAPTYVLAAGGVVSAQQVSSNNDVKQDNPRPIHEIELIKKTLLNVAPMSDLAQLTYNDEINMYYFQTGQDGVEGYISRDGKLIMREQLYRVVEDGSLIDETKQNAIRRTLKQDDSDMVVFPSSSTEEIGSVVVFADISCTYCALLHDNIGQLNDAGITVKYIPYPRSGLRSDVAKKMQTIWCSNEANANLTEAFISLGNAEPEGVERESCKHDVVADGYLLGKSLKLSGTPALVFNDESIVYGYMLIEDIIAKVSLISGR